jgi:hypothetical protein
VTVVAVAVAVVVTVEQVLEVLAHLPLVALTRVPLPLVAVLLAVRGVVPRRRVALRRVVTIVMIAAVKSHQKRRRRRRQFRHQDQMLHHQDGIRTRMVNGLKKMTMMVNGCMILMMKHHKL